MTAGIPGMAFQLMQDATEIGIDDLSRGGVLRIQGLVQIPILLSFYSSQFSLLIFHPCKHLQLTGVCCDCCDCIFSQECDSVTSALFQRLRYEFAHISLSHVVADYYLSLSVR